MWTYIPATPSQLAGACSGGWAPAQAFVVTPDLVADLDDEEVTDEYVRDIAALASVTELGSPRRVVIVADIPPSQVTLAPDRHPAAVDLAGAIPAEAVVCAFVDEKSAEPDARAALDGDDDAVTRLELRDMLWYDATEFADLS
jgi:hypothetical protein